MPLAYCPVSVGKCSDLSSLFFFFFLSLHGSRKKEEKPLHRMKRKVRRKMQDFRGIGGAWLKEERWSEKMKRKETKAVTEKIFFLVSSLGFVSLLFVLCQGAS